MLTREEQLTILAITEALELLALLVEIFRLKLVFQWLLLVVQTRKDISYTFKLIFEEDKIVTVLNYFIKILR